MSEDNMIEGSLAKDVARAAAAVDDWRAKHLIAHAGQLEMRAAKIVKQAQEYRDLAASLSAERE